MFGFSLAELFIVLIVVLIFIKPQDLPEIARFVGKAIFHGKRLYQQVKDSLTQLEKEFELESLKNEVNQAIAEEKLKYHDENEEQTIIVDMYGNEHYVANLKNLRNDLSKEDLVNEVERNNKINQKDI